MKNPFLKNVEFVGSIGVLGFLASIHLRKNNSARKDYVIV
jgi:hypothetical protein